MATTYVGKSAPIRGPYLKHAFAKYVLKGEDAWLQQRDVDTSISASKGVHRHPLLVKKKPERADTTPTPVLVRCHSHCRWPVASLHILSWRVLGLATSPCQVCMWAACLPRCCLHAGAPPCLDVFGIFDGHGGKQIATYASKHLMPALLKELSSGAPEEAQGIDIHSKHPHGLQGTEGGLHTLPGNAHATLLTLSERIVKLHGQHPLQASAAAAMLSACSWNGDAAVF